MKRPYREGDWFAVPLGDRRYAAGVVTHGTHKAIYGRFFGPACDSIAAVRQLAASDPVARIWTGRFSDRALVQLRWPLLGKHRPVADESFAAARLVADPGFVERALAAILAGGSYTRKRLVVRDVRSPADPHAFEAAAGYVRVQWRAPLSPTDLAKVATHAAQSGNANVRLYQTAGLQANEIAQWPSLRTLALEAAYFPEALASFPTVVELAIDGIPRDPGALAEAFPALAILRVRARGGALDARWVSRIRGLRVLEVQGAVLSNAAALAQLSALRVLDVRDAEVDDAGALMRLTLHALRLASIARLRSIGALRGNEELRVLCLAGMLEIDGLNPIAAMRQLESLELRGLWQFGIDDAAFIESMPSLRRLYADIGGRRKNVEIYKRRSLALPLPFQEFCGAGVASIENECGVHSFPA